MTAHQTRVLIIGAGAAGYTAAIYAARANLRPILVTGDQAGGQLTTTSEVENFPGFATSIQGPWLMEQMAEQAANVGVAIVKDTIVEASLGSRPFQCRSFRGDFFEAETVVIATGARARWLGNEPPYLQGRGISGCATCDGPFFRKQSVAVIGGGNTAVEEALYMANIAASVTLIHRRNALRADRILQDRLFNHPKITVLKNAVVQAFLGEGSTGLTGLEVTGAFVAIGHDPATDLFAGQLALRDGYIATVPGSTVTSVPGIFAAGDVQDMVFRQAVTAAGSGCMAALEAERWLSARE